MMRAVRLVVLILCLPLGATRDNNVEWNGVSHITWQDRRPLCPRGGGAFDVFFRAYRFDLTSARVHVDDGTVTWANAAWDHDRGPYAVWKATIPATASFTLTYYIEVTDGTDTDYYSVNGMSDGPPTDGAFVIDYNTLNHAPLGATPLTGGTVFKVWAPSPTSAYVRGDFNGWGLGTPMTKLGGYFIAFVPNASAGQMYKYYFQPGGIWKPDARARALNPGDNYNSRIQSPFSYTWQDSGFQTPPFNEMVCYELHVGTFAGRNDPQASGAIPATYADLVAHADDLGELGINVVQLMPATEFPGDFSAGYNPVTQWAPESKYGTPDNLKHTVDVLHQHGIAVILDIVWNHFSPTDNYLWYYDGSQIYFHDPDVQTPWGSQADFDRPEVRQYFVDSALYWLEEFHLDGFRFDGTDFINMYQGSGWGLMQQVNNVIDNRWIDKVALAEQLPSDSWVTRPVGLGGAGFDSQYDGGFRDRLRGAVLDAAFGDPQIWTLSDGINGWGQYLENTCVYHYLELHDEAWPSSGGERLVRTIDPVSHNSVWAKGRTKLGQGMVMFAPGIPAILQGTEWLEDTNFGAGNSSGADRIDWSKAATYSKILKYYRDIIFLRKNNAALRSDAPHQVFHVNETGNVIAFQRYNYEGNVLVVVANFSNTDYPSYQLGFPQAGAWYELVDSQATGYDGSGLTNCGRTQTNAVPYDGYAQSAWISLPKMGLLVFRYNQPPESFLDVDGDGAVNACDNCPATYNPDQADYNGDGIGDACDCNSNGVLDDQDIADGTSTDLNADGVPDECEGLGDLNCDDTVNAFDIDPFVLALTDPAGYTAAYPDCDRMRADVNGDGAVSAFDIDPFVHLLTGGE